MSVRKPKPIFSNKRFSNFQDKLKNMKTILSTSLGAIDLILLEGMGEISEEQKRFLGVAKKNLESLFAEIQKLIDGIESEVKR